MIAIDTNILVRLLMNDAPLQVQQSRQLFASNKIFIPNSVLLESAWVLDSVGLYSQAKIVEGLRRICGFHNVSIENPKRFGLVLDWVLDGLDFADAFHLANSQMHNQLMTFDKKFVKRAQRTQSNCEVVSLADASKSL
ncbi:MAG TPA: type II toxin-antitoxin system VapC family toxin [Anaerolineae bacterium]|nr:type II toxin-antitoxin system VapC family toxin [Anaerolineae bacterium]